jgi:hypothetical protein
MVVLYSQGWRPGYDRPPRPIRVREPRWQPW